MLDILLPNVCTLCGDSLDLGKVCGLCLSDFKPLREISACMSCGVPLGISNAEENVKCGPCLNNSFYFNSARSVFLYNGNLKKLLQLFKYENIYHLDSFFAEYLSGEIKKLICEEATLMPVPLHINKLRLRGYNQSALICREISRFTGCDCDLFTLKKRLDTRPQVEIKDFTKRAKNVRNAYYTEGSNSILGKKIILIDDVFTSGSTVNECSKVLMDSGAGSVNVVTVARSVQH